MINVVEMSKLWIGNRYVEAYRYHVIQSLDSNLDPTDIVDEGIVIRLPSLVFYTRPPADEYDSLSSS